MSVKNYSEDPTKQYHIQVGRGDVGRYVLLPGDPGRCEQIASLFDESHFVSQNREFVIYTGMLDGERVSVCSTGIGGPSAAIAVEELIECGADTFVRVGTCGGMQLDVESGDIVISTASVHDGSSTEIVDPRYPASASFDVTNALVDASRRIAGSERTHVGVTQSKCNFYGQHDPERMPSCFRLIPSWEEWKSMGCLASEMESATIFAIAAYRRCRAGACFAVVANQEREQAGLENPVNHDTLEASRIAVNAVRALIASDITSHV